MEKKYGVYICKGCGIGDSIDIEKLAKAAKRGPIKEEQIKTHDILCSPDGLGLIKNDMKKDGINTVIIAACSPRVKYDEFDFPGAMTERVNIRELVAWMQPPKTDETQSIAEDYIIMGIARAQKSDLPEPTFLENLSSTILVIGGGITGMTAALEAATSGRESSRSTPRRRSTMSWICSRRSCSVKLTASFIPFDRRANGASIRSTTAPIRA